MAKDIAFLTFEQMRASANLGSSRIRAHWLIKNWPESELYMVGRKYSAVVFQKAYWPQLARSFPGIKILDLCDPDFLQWNSQCMAMADLCDAVTTSTSALANLVARYTKTPAICIPDRIDLDSVGVVRKDHHGQGRARTAAWYGYSTNFASLDFALPYLLACGIERLLVIAEERHPYTLPEELAGSINLTNYAWTPGTVHRHLLEADLVINFKLDKGRWRYKSNNKTILAWALGLPVAHTALELQGLLSEAERIQQADLGHAQVHREYDVRSSVEDYKNLITKIESQRRSVR